jgi:hypothetical protein
MDHFHPFSMAMLNNQRVLATGGRFTEIRFFSHSHFGGTRFSDKPPGRSGGHGGEFLRWKMIGKLYQRYIKRLLFNDIYLYIMIFI